MPKYFIPGAKPWTRREEVRQRLSNFRAMLLMAWWALRHDSFDFATIFVNACRDEGDKMIANVERRGVRMD